MAENTFNPASGVGEVTGRAYYASVTTPNTTFDHEERQRVDTLPKIGNGSLVKVQYGEYSWEYSGKSGKGRDLKAIQLVELKEYIEPDGSGMYDEGDF